MPIVKQNIKYKATAMAHLRRLTKKNPNRFYVVGGTSYGGYKIYSYPRN